MSPTPPPRALPNLAFYGEEVGPSGPGRPRSWEGGEGARGELRPGPARAGHALGAPGLSARGRLGPGTREARSRGHVSLSRTGLAASDNSTPPQPSAPEPWAEAAPGPPRLSGALALGFTTPGWKACLQNGSDHAHLRTAGSYLPGVSSGALHPLICLDLDLIPSPPVSVWVSVLQPTVWTQILSRENPPAPSTVTSSNPGHVALR